MTSSAAPSGVARALGELISSALGEHQRPDPVTRHSGGPAGNAKLTAWTGIGLLVLFLVEGVTLIALHPMIGVHIVVGAAMVPLVLFKTATTGWRMIRYYLGSSDYRAAGPPTIILRLLGPLVVLTGLAVLGTGLALIALGRASFTAIMSTAGLRVDALTLHQASFVAWLVVIGLHTLTRIVPAVQTLVGGRESATGPLPGRRARCAGLGVLVAVSILTGVLVLQASGAWTSGDLHRFRDRNESGSSSDR